MTKKKAPEEVLSAGRPSKYQKSFDEQSYKLALLGATDKDLADFFDVDEATINRWKKEYPTFCESLKKGKVKADMSVAHSLYERANGIKVQTQKAIKLRDTVNGEGSTERVEIVTLEETHPPDVTAMIFWLKNRRPDLWRDKVEFEGTNNIKFDTSNLSDKEKEFLFELSLKLKPNG